MGLAEVGRGMPSGLGISGVITVPGVTSDPARRPLGPAVLYGVDVPLMSFQLHVCGIHIACRDADDASGSGDVNGAGDAAVLRMSTLLVTLGVLVMLVVRVVRRRTNCRPG